MTPGLAGRAFGLDRVAYAVDSYFYHEGSTNYFDRVIPNAGIGWAGPSYYGRSVIHDQKANRDNLFLGYYVSQGYPKVDLMQIAP